MNTLLAFVLCAFFTFPAFSETSPLRIIGAFSRATNGSNGAVFLTFFNESDQDRRVVSAKVSKHIDESVELHTHLQEGNVFKMRPVDSFMIPAQDKRELKPGGDHIMLMGLKSPLNHGFLFNLTVEFDEGESQTVVVPIKSAGAKSATCGCGEK